MSKSFQFVALIFLYIFMGDRLVLAQQDQAEYQIAQTIVRKAQLAGEIANERRKAEDIITPIKKRTHTTSQRALTSLPHTASDAYLNFMMQNAFEHNRNNVPALVDLFFDFPYTTFGRQDRFDNPNFRKAIVNALLEERNHSGWYVFYHGTGAKLSFLYDVLSTYRARFQAVHASTNRRLRFLDRPFIGLDNVGEFKEFFYRPEVPAENCIYNYSRDFENPKFKGGSLGKKNYQDMGLSVNAFIFGSDNVEPSSSINYFAAAKTRAPPNLKSFFDTARKEIGWGKTWEDFQFLFEKYGRNSGRLYQIFIHPDYVDQIGYLAISAGAPLLADMGDGRTSDAPTETLSMLRNNPYDLLKSGYPLFDVQARLFLKPELFCNPEIVQIRVHENKPADKKQEQAFWKELDAMVTEDLTGWILRREKAMDGSLGQGPIPLEELAKRVYLGETGTVYGQEDIVENKMLVLLNLLRNQNLTGTQGFMDDNPSYPINTPLKFINYYDPTNSLEMPPLFFVMTKIKTRQLDFLRIFLEKGADVNTVDSRGNTVLNLALAAKKMDLIDSLLNHEFLAISHKNNDGDSYSHEAIKNGFPEIVPSIHKKGADVNAVDSRGNTVLNLAIREKQQDLIDYLLNIESLDISHINADGISYIHEALRIGLYDVAIALLNKLNPQDPLINMPDKFGNTPLHRVMQTTEFDNTSLVQTLLRKGADITIKNKDGKYPLQLALETEKLDLIFELRKQIKSIPGYQQFIGRGLHVDLGKHDVKDLHSFFIELELQQTITHLSFKGGTVDDVIQICDMVDNLQGISVPNYNLEPDGLTVLVSHFPQITSLDVSNNDLGNQGMEIISTRLLELRELNVAENHMDLGGVQVLATASSLKNLTLLNLGKNNIGPEGAAAIAQNFQHLTSLNLESNNIGDVGAQTLAACPYFLSLTSLNLARNNITQKGVQTLANSPNLKNLTALNLGYSIIFDEGAQTIATSPHLLNLTALNLQHCVIAEVGTQALANSPNFKNLIDLNLRGNNISQNGIQALADSSQLKNLICLNLAYNNISDVGAQILAFSPHLMNLNSLILWNNCISEKGIQALVNSPLFLNVTSLNLWNNRIDITMRTALQKKFGNRIQFQSTYSPS